MNLWPFVTATWGDASPRLAWGVLFPLTLMGCAASLANRDSPKTVRTIVATTGMVADLVQAVAGDDCQVIALMGSGVDPHLYKPTRHDVKLLLDADVVVYSGLMLEGRMGEAFTNLARGGKPVFAATDGLDRSCLRRLERAGGHWDPHVWMDVDAWRQCVGYIASRLAEFDPAHADGYRRRAETYMLRLSELDRRIAVAIQSIPERQRVLITAHDAFGYFSRRYEIPVRSVQGVTTESEAGVGDVNELVDFVVERRVPAIFVESSVSAKTIQAVQEGARFRGVNVAIGAELYSDAMGPAGTYEGTYPGMMDANATRIVRALGGTVPARGLYGKLRAHDEPP
jgi:manganese/zinc/iron transport system substrate-binding protein